MRTSRIITGPGTTIARKINHDCGTSPGGGARVVTTCSGHPDHFMLTAANYDELGNVTVVERAGANKQ